jgi:hypothetical protein
MALKPEKPRPIWGPAAYAEQDVYNVKAVWYGRADANQQRKALEWILYKASQLNEQSFVPDNARVTDFIEGRRSVGNQIVKLIEMGSSSQQTKENG